MLRDDISLSTARVGDGTFVISAAGELDFSTIDWLEAELARAQENGACRVVLDLAAATFVDATTLGAIVAAHRRLRTDGGDLAVVSDDPRLRRVFTVTGLGRTIRIHSSLKDAISELVHAEAAS